MYELVVLLTDPTLFQYFSLKIIPVDVLWFIDPKNKNNLDSLLERVHQTSLLDNNQTLNVKIKYPVEPTC